MRKLNLVVALALLLGLVISSSAAQRSIEGHWEGMMVREGAELPVSFDFTNAAAGLTASFNSPTQRAMGIPLRSVSYTAPKVHFELVGDSTTLIFDGELTVDTITGQFREGEARGTFSIKRVDAKPPTFKQEEVSFRNGDVTLSGTLLLPLTKGPHAAVVFLHGAGSEGRYGARFLAEYFTRHGIAALIYDKRGVGKSTGDWKRSDFNDLAGDAIAGIHFLQQRNEINPKQIGLYGHSQGGMIAPLIDYWVQVSAPVLVIYGERDLYVPIAQSIWNIDRALSKAKNRDYTILVLPRASHAFNIEPEAGQPFEWWHMASGFPNLLTAWINQRMK